MRLSYDIENGRKSITLESDDNDSEDVNAWSEGFQWLVDFEARTTCPVAITTSPLQMVESFKSGALNERAAVTTYLRDHSVMLIADDSVHMGDVVANLARDIGRGLHVND